jgi:hypothetical protein
MKQTNETEVVRANSKDVLEFLKERYPLYHLSNIFFRDVHYGVREYLEKKGMTLGYVPAEGVAREFIHELEGQGILTRVDRQTWTLHYPEFQTPQAKAPEPVKQGPKSPAPPPKDPVGGKAGQ